MANRLMANRTYSHERDIKRVFAKVAIGATGAPTLDVANSKGVLSITRGTAGLYTIVFGTSVNGVNALDTYVKFLHCDMSVQNATGVPAAPTLGVKAVNIADATLANLVVQTVNNAGAAADPANGDTLYFEFEFGDSSAG